VHHVIVITLALPYLNSQRIETRLMPEFFPWSRFPRNVLLDGAPERFF
jgi:hypothetical protein